MFVRCAGAVKLLKMASKGQVINISAESVNTPSPFTMAKTQSTFG